MVVERFLKMGTARSRIREQFEYGMAQAAIVGKENVYDFSIGNPSVPTPEAVADTVRELLKMDPIALHGYTPPAAAPRPVKPSPRISASAPAIISARRTSSSPAALPPP